MNLRTFLKKFGIDREDIFLLRIETDGLNPSKDNLMAIEGGFLDGNPSSVYVAQEDMPDFYSEYVNVDPEEYVNNAVSSGEVNKWLWERNPGVIMMYKTEFTLPFLGQVIPVHQYAYKFIDILSAAQFTDAGNDFSGVIGDSFKDSVEEFKRNVNISNKPSLRELASRFDIEGDQYNKLRKLTEYLLDK